MAVQIGSEEGRVLRRLVPLESFPNDAFTELCTKITVEQVEDKTIFIRGDTNPDLVYLLNGKVTLQAGGLVVDVISSGSESAKFALAHQIPRKIDAVANGVARIVRLDADMVNNPPEAVYQENQGFTLVEDFSEDSDDWMAALLRLPLFQNLSPINLQKILISLKTAHFSEGEVILGEESPVDYFYLIIKGQCLLTRKLQDEGEASQVKLVAGESFGEEYLVTETLSQETVTAVTDVSLIQLEKNHFLSNIKTPLVGFIAQENVPDALQNGAVLLDVRLPKYFEKQNLVGSANIPLLTLRMRIAEIPKDKQVIVVCAQGAESEAAAFLLTKNNINALVLKGGMGIEEIEGEDEQEEGIAHQEKVGRQEIAEIDSPVEKLMPEGGSVVAKPIENLNAENQRLIQVNRDLEAKIRQLQGEKEAAENKNQVLNQQLERLKDILNRLTKSK